MQKLTAKEIRALAWGDLAAKQFWPFVGGQVVLGMIVGAIVVGGILAVMAPALLMTGGGAGADPWHPAFLLPVFLLSCVAAVPALYAFGYSTWGFSQMALAAARRTFRFELCLSGWGHGWKMCWLLLVKWTYVQLWFLLLIVPGVVKMFAYAMAEFVQIEHPDWTADRCIAESQRLMDGNKYRYFMLNFSFLGWWVLCVLASFVPIAGNLAGYLLWPYVTTAQARFYDEVKRGTAQQG